MNTLVFQVEREKRPLRPLREEKEKNRFHDSSSREAVLPGADTGLIINKRVTRINGPLISGRPNVDSSSFDYYTDSIRSISCDNIFIYIYITFVLFITLKRTRGVPESQSVTLLSLLRTIVRVEYHRYRDK